MKKRFRKATKREEERAAKLKQRAIRKREYGHVRAQALDRGLSWSEAQAEAKRATK